MPIMKVLVACEFSGIVRDAFAKRGHEAWSCDLLPTEKPGNHIQGDVLAILNDGWDMMIAHPPCTYLSYVGMRHWNKPGRHEKREDALTFFMMFINSNINKICVENPLGYPSQAYRAPDQIIHPYYFGEPIQKRTCLWLKNLPPLIYRMTDELFGNKTAVNKPEPMYICQGEKCLGKKIHYIEGMRGVKDRSHERSRFFVSIANAMAEQWNFS
jgi:hypothetical protein